MILFISPEYGNSPGAITLLQAAQKRNIRCETLHNAWTGKLLTRYPEAGTEGAPYGNNAFAEFLGQELRWNLRQNSLSWILQLPKQLVKRDIRRMTADKMHEEQQFKRNMLGNFFEPVDGRSFLPGTYDNGLPDLPDEEEIFVSEPVVWTVKYRYVIIDGRIASWCCYRVFNVFNNPSIWRNLTQEKGVTNDSFVRTVLDHYRGAPAYILDVGFIKDRGWAVVGSYPMWSSEVYGCDGDAFLQGLFTACEPV